MDKGILIGLVLGERFGKLLTVSGLEPFADRIGGQGTEVRPVKMCMFFLPLNLRGVVILNIFRAVPIYRITEVTETRSLSVTSRCNLITVPFRQVRAIHSRGSHFY